MLIRESGLEKSMLNLEGKFMDNKIKVCVVGIGNCCSALVQGLSFYDNLDIKENIHGLMHKEIGNFRPSDIAVVAAFDVDKHKVYLPLNLAIFEKPNCTNIFNLCGNLHPNPIVLKAPILDGIAEHMKDYFQVDENQMVLTKEQIISHLRNKKTDIIISYLPVGSQLATEFWADIALESGCAFINAIPVFIASNEQWAEKFRHANLPIIGDDVKSQVGSTIVNRYLVQMIQDRGGKIINSWQTNFGGNTDFLNMTSQDRLESKKISKTESISSLLPDKNNYVYAGPNGFIKCLNDNKVSHMRIDFKIFGNISCYIDLKLSVEDSPNSAGCVIDCIRMAKIALDKKLGGPLISACAYFCKHPPIQMKDEDARYELETFIMEN